MAVASNNSEEAVVSSLKLYSGIFPFQVVAINPTLQALKDLGVNAQKDPEYSVVIQEETYNKLVFWLKADYETPFLTKFEILAQPKERVSQDGTKTMFINNIGQMSWSKDIPTFTWWKNPDKTRKAYVGEDTLINFTKAWANVATDGEVAYDTIDKIVNGDVAEIANLIKVLGNNRLRLLVGVKDEKYQVVYNKHFGRIKPERNDLFTKELNGDYGSFKADYNPDLLPREYTPTPITPDAGPGVPAGAAAGDDGQGKDLWEQ